MEADLMRKQRTQEAVDKVTSEILQTAFDQVPLINIEATIEID